MATSAELRKRISRQADIILDLQDKLVAANQQNEALVQAVEAAYIWFAAEAEFPDEDADDYPPIDMLKTRIRAMRLVQKAAILLGWERPEVRVPTDGEDPIQPGDTVIVHGRSSDWRTDDRPESTEVIWPDTLINYDLTPEHKGDKP